MKILKTLAVLAIAAAVVLTGCENNFGASSLDTGVLAERNNANRSDIGGLTAPSLSAGAVSNTKNQELTITFGLTNVIDVATIPTAITIYNLSNAATATDVYVRGNPVSYTVQYTTGNTAVLNLDLTGASALLEVFVDSTKLTGRNGALKLDMDLDNVQGEANDDDVFLYKAVGIYTNPITSVANTAPTAVTIGVARNPRAGMTFTFGGFSAVGAGVYLLNTYTATYDQAIAPRLDNNDYKTLFDSCIVIENYVPSSNSWTAVTKTSVYSTSTGLYTATFAGAVEGSVYRAKLVNIPTLVTAKAYSGFVQRLSMKAKETNKILTVSAPATVTPLDVKILTPAEQNTAFTVTSAFDSNGFNGKIVIDLNLAVVGNLGLDLTSLTKANLKIAKLNGVGDPTRIFDYASYSTACTNPVYPAVVTRIILNLDPSYKNAVGNFVLMVSPGLKTLGQTTPLPVINARVFGNPENIDWIPGYNGWNVIDNVSGTL